MADAATPAEELVPSPGTDALPTAADVLWDRRVPPLPADLLAQYFAFVGVEAPGERNMEALAALQAAHLHAIPFENLDALLGKPISLAPADLAAKLLSGTRGGYCFEHNLLFAAVLSALGYEPDLLAGRVLVGATAPRPHTHLALRVQLDGKPILSDVGFGRTALRGPLKLQTGIEQTLGSDRFRLVDIDGEFLLQLQTAGGAWDSQYILDPRPRFLVDCEMANYFVAGAPNSTMRERVIVLQPTPTGKRAIGGRRLIIDEAGRQESREVTEGEIADVLLKDFGIVLPAPLASLDITA